MTNKKIPLLAIVGPTATGKTKLAVALAKEKNGEIVSADSMQIYKKMDIGTAKPSKEELGQVKHHLVDFLDIDEKFSVARYKELADEEILKIYNKGKLPIIVGGTGLYIDTVVNNINFLDNSNDEMIRQKLWDEEKKYGIEKLYRRLEEIDSQYAQKIEMNNKRRVIRALEVYLNTGKTMSQQIELSTKNESNYDTLFIGLDYEDRQNLYNVINDRVDKMVSEGLIEEAKIILSQDKTGTALGAIGYKELKPYFDGNISLDIAIEKIKQGSRRYAKRQNTWFRRNKLINWIKIDKCSNFEEIKKEALNIVNRIN